MLKKFILLLCLVAPVALIAQEKIAYVNSQEVMFKMPELKDVESKMATKGEALKKSLTAIESEYQTKTEEYMKKLEKFQGGDSAITESELMDNQKNLSQLQERYETHAQSTQAEYEKYQQELFAPINEKVRKAIKEVGDEQNYKYIIDSNAILYIGSSAIDANKQVKTKLGIVD